MTTRPDAVGSEITSGPAASPSPTITVTLDRSRGIGDIDAVTLTVTWTRHDGSPITRLHLDGQEHTYDGHLLPEVAVSLGSTLTRRHTC